MASYLILISSAPDTKNSERAFTIAEGIKDNGNNLSLFFIQDGVRAAINNSQIRDVLNRFITSGVRCYALDEDLKLRGIEKENLLTKVELAGYNELMVLMTAEGVSTLGAF
jgi:sulfur relay protein TusB/DsrH